MNQHEKTEILFKNSPITVEDIRDNKELKASIRKELEELVKFLHKIEKMEKTKIEKFPVLEMPDNVVKTLHKIARVTLQTT